MPAKLTYEIIKSYIESFVEYILLSKEYINNRTKLKIKCPVGHEFEMRFDNFKYLNQRCPYCVGNAKHTIKNVKVYLKNFFYECLSDVYINTDSILEMKCPEKHIFFMTFNNFRSGHRCPECSRINNSGKNHYNYNPNRNEIKLNKRLRITRKRNWIIKNMKHDINYNNFLSCPFEYQLDHIIPIKIFCEIVDHYDLDETEVRQIINKVDNLQILLKKENREKYYDGNIFEATQYLMVNGIKL